MEEFEQLYKVSEDKRNALISEVEKLKSDITAERNNVTNARKLTNEEISFKLLAETKCKKLTEELELLQEENASYKDQCQEFKSYSSSLSEELNMAEQKTADLELEIRNLSRQNDNCLSENKILKEENSLQLTHLNCVKESNYNLSQDLNESRVCMTIYSLKLKFNKNNFLQRLNKVLFEQIEQLNNMLLEKDMYQKERELKTESTIQQQTKLIDFLQSKVS